MNKEIKVIDLLNMIAEGKEVPEKIMYDTEIYYKLNAHTYIREQSNGLTVQLYDDYNLINCLNDTVEIIEEDNNKIEKIDTWSNDIEENQFILKSKIDEIIDKINNMED